MLLLVLMVLVLLVLLMVRALLALANRLEGVMVLPAILCICGDSLEALNWSNDPPFLLQSLHVLAFVQYEAFFSFSSDLYLLLIEAKVADFGLESVIALLADEDLARSSTLAHTLRAVQCLAN